MSYTYKYPHFALTIDCLIFSKLAERPAILLIQRKHDPFKDSWAYPGGFIDIDELIEDAVHRELQEETGIENLEFHKLDYFDAIDRDPRDRTISFAYWTYIEDINEIKPKAQDDAKAVDWFFINDLPSLAFDHNEILIKALQNTSIREKLSL